MAAAVMQTAVVRDAVGYSDDGCGARADCTCCGKREQCADDRAGSVQSGGHSNAGVAAGYGGSAAVCAVENRAFRRRAMAGAVRVEVEACPLQVYLCENLSSPCLCGLLRPVILVNDGALENETYFALALRHELAHYCRKDRFSPCCGSCAARCTGSILWCGSERRRAVKTANAPAMRGC